MNACSICFHCVHRHDCKMFEPSSVVGGCYCFKKDERITNAERITASVEELAKFIADIADCKDCEELHGFRMCDAAPDRACEDCWAGWLRKEAT